jgi:hypothetical protein
VEILRSEQVSAALVARFGFGRWGENLAAETIEAVLRAMAEAGHRETAIGILAHRIESNSAESVRWEPFAVELVTSSDLIRSGQMAGYYWKQIARTLIGSHSNEIAAAIFREQADRDSGIWFIEHSDAAEVLGACVERDAGGVWQALRPHLSSPGGAVRFSIGFPDGVVDRMPANEVSLWIAEKPEERASTISRLASKDLSNDQTLGARILGEYGDVKQVGAAFFSTYVSGSWWGNASSHWATLAQSLDEVANRTKLPKLREWALDGARSLREMAGRDRQREEEEELRGLG